MGYSPLPEGLANSILLLITLLISWVPALLVHLLFLAPLGRENDQLKSKWLMRYGSEVLAQVTKVEVEKDSEDVNTPYYSVRLVWQDPQTGRDISFRERTKEPALMRYPVGSRLPVRYDPDDPSFYSVSWLTRGV